MYVECPINYLTMKQRRVKAAWKLFGGSYQAIYILLMDVRTIYDLAC